MKTFIARFLRSPFGLTLIGLDLVLCLTITLSGWVPGVLALPLFLVLGVVGLLVGLQTPAGARSLIAETERQRAERDAEVLAGVAAARKRLSQLRLADLEIKAVVGRLVLAAGKYLESVAKGGYRDPELEGLVNDSLEIVDSYQRLADSQAETRHFRGSQLASVDENRDLSLRLLSQQAATMEERLALLAGGLPGGIGTPAVADLQAAHKELS